MCNNQTTGLADNHFYYLSDYCTRKLDFREKKKHKMIRLRIENNRTAIPFSVHLLWSITQQNTRPNNCLIHPGLKISKQTFFYSMGINEREKTMYTLATLSFRHLSE